MVIAVANQKGGVCKSTTVVCLADALRRRGHGVLVVDLDQQRDASKVFGAGSEGVATSYDVLTRAVPDVSAAIQRTPHGDVVPGDELLVGVESAMSRMSQREVVLAEALDPVAPSYDYVLVDCPPNLGIATANALVAADAVLVPTLVDAWAVDGMAGLMSLIAEVRGPEGSRRRLNPSLGVMGLVLCRYKRERVLTKSFEAQAPALAAALGTEVLPARCVECKDFSEAVSRGEFLYDYAPSGKLTAAYERLADDVVARSLGGRG